MNPKALWIWPGNAFYMQNSYAGFRHDFNMEKMPSSAPLEITADQSYRLHVNGRYVCRGPVRGYQHHWPFDEVDILPYLKNGHNWISVEAYNPGIGTFAYNHADRAGFLCSAEWDNGVQILSRIKDWTVFRNTAYAHDTARLSIQLGWQEEVDLRYDDRSWITAETDFRIPPQPDWCHPAEAVQGSLPWSALERRNIPMLNEHEQAPTAVVSFACGTCAEPAAALPYAEHNIAWDFAKYELDSLNYGEIPSAHKEGNFLCCEVPASGAGRLSCVTFDLGADEWLTGTPVLEYEGAEPGLVFDLLYSHWLPEGRVRFEPKPGCGCLISLAARVIAGAERERCELYQIMGVRHVSVVVRENKHPLKLKLSWRSSVYPMKISGSFRCSDEVLNGIYRASVHTQRVCSMDAFVDTPWREQSQWWGDARVQAKNTHFLTADSALLRQGIHSISGQHAPDNLTFADAPTTDCGCVLPDFCLTWLATLHDLWFQTGETEHLREQKSRAEDILAYFDRMRDSRGLVKADPRYWLFEDWCDLPRDNTPAFLNLWHLYAVTLYCKFLKNAGHAADAGLLEQKIAAERVLLKKAFFDPEQNLFVPELDRDGKRNGTPSVHDQVLALLCGLAPEAEKTMLETRILPYLKGTLSGCAQPSSFWATYLFDVAGEFGLRAEALAFIREKWAPMIPSGTVWETFSTGWSYSHAWSAHAISHLPELVFGLKQTAPAWREIELNPLLNVLESAEMKVPTPQGMIQGSLKSSGSSVTVRFGIPAGIRAAIHLPDETVETDGEAVSVERELK